MTPRYERRSHKHAHGKITFWLAWIACSAFLFSIILNVVHIPPKGAKLHYPIFDDWDSNWSRKLLGNK